MNIWIKVLYNELSNAGEKNWCMHLKNACSQHENSKAVIGNVLQAMRCNIKQHDKVINFAIRCERIFHKDNSLCPWHEVLKQDIENINSYELNELCSSYINLVFNNLKAYSEDNIKKLIELREQMQSFDNVYVDYFKYIFLCDDITFQK